MMKLVSEEMAEGNEENVLRWGKPWMWDLDEGNQASDLMSVCMSSAG